MSILQFESVSCKDCCKNSAFVEFRNCVPNNTGPLPQNLEDWGLEFNGTF